MFLYIATSTHVTDLHQAKNRVPRRVWLRVMPPPPSSIRGSSIDDREAAEPVAVLPMVGDPTRPDVSLRIDAVDAVMGFARHDAGKRTGWLVNMHTTCIAAGEGLTGHSGVDYYFLDAEGGLFKATLTFDPYMFIKCVLGRENEVEEFLKRKLEGSLKTISRVVKQDLAMPNHLVGLRLTLLKLEFGSTTALLEARRILMPIVVENQTRKELRDLYASVNTNYHEKMDTSECLEDIREYDVPFHVRVAIDLDIRVGKWYDVVGDSGMVRLSERTDLLAFADPVVLAFDIETTKPPLKFPDPALDQVMMISYMIDGEGFLITNREIVSTDIDDFEYTPKPEYKGEFTIFNELDEKAVLSRFFEHVRDACPTVIATFNGDFFDWPFVETRAAANGLDMFEEIGFAKDLEGEFKSKYCVHMDCFRWVQRDLYLPQGLQGLKAVTTAKLGYNPLELDPELMVPYAREKPQVLAEYSVSDAVATFYLYSKYVHPFIFSLCTILPLKPDEVLRKGTGTLCEMLLMVQAYQGGILLPNKHTEPLERFYNGHLVELETYVGGHVESLEAGVFRSDISTHFKVDPSAIDELVGDLKAALRFLIEVEEKKKVEDVANFDEVYEEVKAQLLALKAQPVRNECPLIYHVDVALMYPNIMTTNRLQPDSMKQEKDCAACDFNRPGKTCNRVLPWLWRGEFYPADTSDYGMIKRALEAEEFPPAKPWLPKRRFDELPAKEQALLVKKRVGEYSRKVYHRLRNTEVRRVDSVICQRENPFYVDTVRGFRDRRYEFKGLAKVWKGKVGKADSSHAKDEARKMVVLYDSLQLAHKVILNSFYGYVMRKGLRWYLMEMAGITCLTGATIIQMARKLVERLGRPLELDTDGIWCILPKLFPEFARFKMHNGKELEVLYPCSMLNYLVHQQFTNHQYQELADPERLAYSTKLENSIFFEVDGPYKAMVLPTLKEEGKGLKKRYAVFNEDGLLAELKGFEIKRRGELQLVKNFQSDIFKLFLEGDTLELCYGAVALVANRWLDVLDSRGAMLEDEDLIELICENRMMTKPLSEYAGQKLTSITTAKRLGQFFGEETVRDKGLACKYVISKLPHGAPVTERAVPVVVFSADEEVKRRFLSRWLLDRGLQLLDPRDIIDWDYYKERLALVVMKIITIPAASQGVANPVPRVKHPEWLLKKIARDNDPYKQSLLLLFLTKGTPNDMVDIEDAAGDAGAPTTVRRGKVTLRKRKVETKPVHADPMHEQLEAMVAAKRVPDMFTDYQMFLRYQFVKWEQERTARQNRTRLFGDTRQLAIHLLVRRQAEHLHGLHWQVLLVKEGAVAGDVSALVAVDGSVSAFTVHVPRTVYVSVKGEVPESRFAFESCDMTVPVATAGSTYRVTLLEADFVAECASPAGVFNHPHVLLVYESEVTPVDRFIISLGCCVQFGSSQLGALGRGLNHGFDLADLKAVEHQRYLSSLGDVACVVHTVANGYEIYAVYRSWEARVEVVVLRPSALAPPVSEKAMASTYEQVFALKEARLVLPTIAYLSALEVEVSHHTSPLGARRALTKSLLQLLEQRLRPLVAVLLPTSLTLPVLRDIPCVQLPASNSVYPLLNWQPQLYRRLAACWLLVAAALDLLVATARYTNVPIGNAGGSYGIDVEYARRLVASQCVLWWLASPLPDLGGEVRAPLDLSFPSRLNADMYTSACVEMEVENGSINALLTLALLLEAIDGALASDAFQGPLLAALRTMVKGWWDAAVATNATAEQLVDLLVPWVFGLTLRLHDPVLAHHLHTLTLHNHMMLCSEFAKMGLRVVYSDRDRVVLATSKPQVETVYAYAQYMVKAVRSRPHFTYLDVRVSQYWDVLVWVDGYNYGGRGCGVVTEAEVQTLEATGRWLTPQFLPPVLQPEFHDWVGVVIDALVRHKLDDVLSQRLTQIGHLVKKETHEVTEVFLSLRRPLVQRFKHLIRKQTELMMDPELRREYASPVLRGLHRDTSNPTLELAKDVLCVLGVGSAYAMEVALLRQEVLGLFEVREFLPQAQFVDPCTLLVVGGVGCAHCHHVYDVDFCRDEEAALFGCPRCGRPANRIGLEERLVLEAVGAMGRFYSQDLRCGKCARMRAGVLAAHCECSGAWEETVTRASVDREVLVFGNVARLLDLRLLEDVLLDWH